MAFKFAQNKKEDKRTNEEKVGAKWNKWIQKIVRIRVLMDLNKYLRFSQLILDISFEFKITKNKILHFNPELMIPRIYKNQLEQNLKDYPVILFFLTYYAYYYYYY